MLPQQSISFSFLYIRKKKSWQFKQLQLEIAPMFNRQIREYFTNYKNLNRASQFATILLMPLNKSVCVGPTPDFASQEAIRSRATPLLFA